MLPQPSASHLPIRTRRVLGRLASEHLLSKPKLHLRSEAYDRGVGGIARTAELDRLDLFHAPRARAHDGDAIRQLDRLVDAVRHENDGLGFPLPDLEKFILHVLARLDV